MPANSIKATAGLLKPLVLATHIGSNKVHHNNKVHYCYEEYLYTAFPLSPPLPQRKLLTSEVDAGQGHY